LREGEVRTDRLPAFNLSRKDVSGAGDSFFMSSAMALCVLRLSAGGPFEIVLSSCFT